MIHSYPWYPHDWRTSEAVLGMTAEQRDVYRNLLDVCWMEGSLPTDEKLLCKLSLADAKEWKRSWPAIKEKFCERDGRLHHSKVDERRPELERWHEQRRDAGRKSGEARRNKSRTDDERQFERPFNGSSNDRSTVERTGLEPSASPQEIYSSNQFSEIQNSTAANNSEPPQLAAVPNLSEWPETAQRIREHFMDADEPMVLAIVGSAVRMVPPQVDRLTDSEIAEAVRRCTKPTQHSAGMYLKTVPAYVKNLLNTPGKRKQDRQMREYEAQMKTLDREVYEKRHAKRAAGRN